MKKILKNKWLWAGAVVVVALVLWQMGIFSPAEVPADAQ